MSLSFYLSFVFFFFFNDTATTEIYTLSLHDALPILRGDVSRRACRIDDAALAFRAGGARRRVSRARELRAPGRSEEHTSELQSRLHLVCRLLLEKKKKKKQTQHEINMQSKIDSTIQT